MKRSDIGIQRYRSHGATDAGLLVDPEQDERHHDAHADQGELLDLDVHSAHVEGAREHRGDALRLSAEDQQDRLRQDERYAERRR